MNGLRRPQQLNQARIISLHLLTQEDIATSKGIGIGLVAAGIISFACVSPLLVTHSLDGGAMID